LGVKTLFIEPGESLGERVYRIVKWQAERRVVEPGNIYNINRSEGIDWAMGKGI